MSHEHEIPTSGKRLTAVVALNLTITLAEVVGGLISGSLSLVSDAIHNLSDALAVVIAWVAMRLGMRPANQHYTFGLKRAEVIAAFINAGTLVGISVYLVIEAVKRLIHPQPVTGSVMTVVALIGLVANVAGTWLLHQGAGKNTNLRAVYLHLLSDAMSSLGVVVGGVAILYWDVFWVDPVLTILISLYIFKESVHILKHETDMVLLASPPGVSLDEVRNALMDVPGVQGVHHVHLWEVSDHDIHLEAHIKVGEATVSQTDQIRLRIQDLLEKRFNIHHVTLQCESLDTPCDTEDRP